MSLNTVVEKYNANISRAGIYARFHVPISGTITAADVLAATVSGYNWLFNLAINGVGQFSGASRFNVGPGTESVNKTGLSVAVTKGDLITFVCEAAGTGGGLFAPTEFAITIDDGLTPVGVVIGPGSATDAAVALYDGTTGKLIKDSAKTISTDGTLASNSDSLIPTQKAVKTYADQLLAAADAMTFKGVINCSANPNYPAGNAGDVYRVSVAGKIGGASGPNVEVSDQLLCLTDSTASGDQATVGANWSIAQANIDGAVVGPTSATADAIALFNSTTGKIIKDSAKTISIDGTLASNSDALIPTEKAVKTYVDGHVGGGGGPALPAYWAYYEADAESMGAGSPATGWTNLEGTASRNMTNGTTAPTKRVDSGIHSFDMNAPAYFLGTSMQALIESELFVVWKQDSTAQCRLHNIGDATADNYFPYTDGKIYEGYGVSARQNALTISGVASRTAFWCYNVSAGPNALLLRANGHLFAASNANFYPYYTTSPRWGSQTGGTCIARIAAIYIFERRLTITERFLKEAEIATKYGITFAL